METLLPLLLLLLLPPGHHPSLVSDSILTDLVEPWHILETSPSHLHLAMIVSGSSREDVEHFTGRADRLLYTLLSLSK